MHEFTPAESGMQGAVSFGVAAVLGGGWCGRVGAESERTLSVRTAAHAARALVPLLEKSSDKGYNVTA